jgi:methyl halide transferase
MARVNEPRFWEDAYARGGDGWDLASPTPALADFLATTPPPRGRVAVPGCGRGHDARLLARHGYDVTGFDFSPFAVDAARRLAARERVDARFEQRDVLTLGREYPHAFDGVWEYTCYCAIDPTRRAEYVDALAGTLRPGGWLLACFFPLRWLTAGPPFVACSHPRSRSSARSRLASPHADARVASGWSSPGGPVRDTLQPNFFQEAR